MLLHIVANWNVLTLETLLNLLEIYAFIGVLYKRSVFLHL